MINLKEKLVEAKEQVSNAFNGILIILSISFVMGITAWIIKDTDVNTASVGFWSLITLVVTSLFVIIHARFKN